MHNKVCERHFEISTCGPRLSIFSHLTSPLVSATFPVVKAIDMSQNSQDARFTSPKSNSDALKCHQNAHALLMQSEACDIRQSLSEHFIDSNQVVDNLTNNEGIGKKEKREYKCKNPTWLEGKRLHF